MVAPGSKKSLLVQGMCIALYIILGGLLLFYVEHCANGEVANAGPGFEIGLLRNKCVSALTSVMDKNVAEQTRTPRNWSVEDCLEVAKMIHGTQVNEKVSCNFSPRNYLPWLHRVTFSLMTIGGTQVPVTAGGQALSVVLTILGIFPVIRFFMHAGAMISHSSEQVILKFELRVLNRSPRMIHSLARKVILLQGLVVVIYNLAIAKATSLPFFRMKLTFLGSIRFWISGMTTTGHVIEAERADEFYSNGGWRIICVDVGMIIGLVLVSGIVSSMVESIHKKHCPASQTIRKAFKSQNPEVYLQIKPLKTHL